MLKLNYDRPKYFAGSQEIANLEQVLFSGKFYDVDYILGDHKHYVIEIGDTVHYLCDLMKQQNVYATSFSLK